MNETFCSMNWHCHDNFASFYVKPNPLSTDWLMRKIQQQLNFRFSIQGGNIFEENKFIEATIKAFRS